MLTLRPYQQKMIEDVRHAMLTTRSVLLQAPTGSGKTATTAEMLHRAVNKGKRSWFIVHRVELVKQSVLAFHKIGLKVGICASGFPEAKRLPIQVCSIQTLIRRHKNLHKPDFIVWDECAHIAAKSWASLYKNYADCYHVGLTATPWRSDGSGLEDFFSTMVLGPSVSWLINNGYLSTYKLYAPATVNLSGVHSRMGDFVKSELAMAVDKPSITGDAIKHYQKLCNGKRAIVFCASVEHSKHVVAQFNASGITAEHVDGETEDTVRDGAVRRFRDGKTTVLSNVDLFGEGFDIPSTEAVIMLRPTQSLALYLQQIGRGLRIAEGKHCAYILDHAGNSMRHGLPDDEREWSLKGIEQSNKKQSEKVLGVRICKNCFGACRPTETVCRYCGNPFEIKYRKVAEQDGELKEVDIIQARRVQKMEQGRATTLEQLTELGKRRGYKRPHLWAAWVIRARKQKQEMKNG